MLSARPTNIRRTEGLKVSNGSRVGPTNKPKPLQTSTNKPKPLQASTNTIHAQQRALPNLKSGKKSQSEEEPIKKKATKVLPENANIKVDENYVDPFVQGSYNPLLDVQPFDEELYQKVLKLELADDGLPSFLCDEPFDF